MVGNLAFVVADEVAGLTQHLNQRQNIGFSDLLAQVRDQVADEFAPGSRPVGGGLAKVFQNPHLHCL